MAYSRRGFDAKLTQARAPEPARTPKEYTNVYIHSNACDCVVADVFTVLADPTRRRLVELLHDGERSVNELVSDVGIHQPGVSRHLRILHEAGFVAVRPDGQRRLYSLRPEPFVALDAWVKPYCKAVAARLDRFGKLVGSREPR